MANSYTSMLPARASVDENALFNVSTPEPTSDTGYSSGKASLEVIADAVVNDLEYATSLDTEDKTIAGAINELNEKISEIGEDVWGLEVDFENNRAIRLGGAVGRTGGVDFDEFLPWQRRRCNLADDGTVNAYYGDAEYTEDGSNGQVMVEQPPFWYKVVPIKTIPNTDSNIGRHLVKARYYISASPRNGFKLHPAFYGQARPIYLSAYEGSYYDSALGRIFDDDSDTSTAINAGDKLCSIGNNTKPISGKYKNITKANLETIAQNRGSAWHLETVQTYMASLLLFMVEYGGLNSQSLLGQGVVSITDDASYNCASLTGSTASLGNASGMAASTINRKGETQTTETANGKVAITYRGQENIWGNVWKNLNAINLWGDGAMAGGQAYVNDGLTGYNESTTSDPYYLTEITLPNGSGYAKYLGYSASYDWLFLVSKIGDGASTSTIIGDYCSISANLNAYRVALLGSYWNSGETAGSLYWHGNAGPGLQYRTIGGRLVFIPD